MSKYLVIGSGAREHAIAWKIASEGQNTVYVAPGNPGIATDKTIAGCVNIDPNDFEAIVAFVQKEFIRGVIVGPEAPLANGIVDFLRSKNVTVFGPTKEGAQLETSKNFAKEILKEAGVKTADFQVFDNADESMNYLRNAKHPIVIKVDGLAAGKGVFVCNNIGQSTEAINTIFRDNRFGQSGNKILIEEFLSGKECSFILITDGQHIVPFSTSRDYKRLRDNDEGPNTGGMGAISPSPDVDEELHSVIVRDLLKPLFAAFKKRGFHYQGFLYVGLMLTDDGPYVLEFNARLGDPEAEALMFGLTESISNVINATNEGFLNEFDSHHSEGFLSSRCLCEDNYATCTVIMATGNYPESSGKGQVIKGLDQVDEREAKVFFAGVGQKDGELVTNGGRVLAVTAKGDTPEEAREKAYRAVEKITWDGEQHRTDIGK